MGDLLQTGSIWLESQRHKHLAHLVAYCRGAETVLLLATVGQTSFEVEREFGLEKVESRDFLVRTQDLVLGDQQVEPRRGDRVKEAVGNEMAVFEVMAPGDEPPWRYSDPGRQTLRIHTKQVDTE